MIECTSCDGKGLRGSGDRPFDLAGKVDTCSECGGTGKVGEVGEISPKVVPLEELNENVEMAHKIVFDTEAEKVEAIAEEKAAHPEPTAHQAAHLAALEAAEVVG